MDQPPRRPRFRAEGGRRGPGLKKSMATEAQVAPPLQQALAGNFCDGTADVGVDNACMFHDSHIWSIVYIPIVFSPKIHGLLRLNPLHTWPNYDGIHGLFFM